MISLVATLILVIFFGLAAFACYSDNRMKLGMIFAALVVFSVVVGAATYPFIDGWQQSMKTQSDAEYAAAMIKAFGSADAYIRYLEAKSK